MVEGSLDIGHSINAFDIIFNVCKKSVEEPPESVGPPHQSTDGYNLKIKGCDSEKELKIQELKKQLLRRILPPTNTSQNTQDMYGNATTSKNTYTNNKSRSITLEDSNKVTPLENLALPIINEIIDYNIIQDMKKSCANISIFELTKIAGHHELLFQAFSSQSPSGNKASTSQMVSSKSLGILKSIVNIVNLNTNTLYSSFLLIFEIFHYNFHNCLVDSGASENIIPLNVAKKINAKWDKIDD